MTSSWRRLAAIVLCWCLLAAACGDDDSTAANEAPPTSASESAEPAGPSEPVEDLDPARTHVASFDEPVDHYAEPEGGEPDGRLDPRPDDSDGRGFDGFVLAAPYDRSPSRYEVHLDDGTRAWIEAADVTVEPINVVLTGRGTAVDSTGTGGGGVAVFESPGDPEPAQEITNPRSAEGLAVAPVVLLANGPYDPTAEFVDVHLPVRPNGSTGFVRASDVEVSTNRHHIEVALGAHELRLFEGDELVLETPIGVGTDNTPTPGGVFYIRSLIASIDPVYGTYAFGLSGFSDVHSSFNGGPGDIGIHGTNDPSTIGSDVSNGCIRLEDDFVVLLAHVLPEAGAEQSVDPRITTGLGVPVEVLA